MHRSLKSLTFIVVVVLSLASGGFAVSQQPEMRTWTDSKGKYNVRAAFEDRRTGKVILKKEDGVTISVPLRRLSATDRFYVFECVCEGIDADPDKAITDATKEISANPGNAEAHYRRAVAHFAKFKDTVGDDDDETVDPTDANWTEALADLATAIRADPTSGEAHKMRATMYMAKGDYDKSVADLTEAIQIDPEDAVAYAFRAIAYSQGNKSRDAVSDCEAAIQIAPTFAGAYLARANVFMAMGLHEKVIADCTKAIQIDPKNDTAYGLRWITYKEMGESEKAEADRKTYRELLD